MPALGARSADGWWACLLLKGGMLDLIFIVVTIGFFGLSIAYTHGCDRL